MEANFQFELTGEGGGTWVISVAGGQCQVKEGAIENPDVTVEMSTDDYVGMAKGQLNPMNLFMTGKIKLSGNMGLAMKVMNLFEVGG